MVTGSTVDRGVVKERSRGLEEMKEEEEKEEDEGRNCMRKRAGANKSGAGW